jgi:hypothetical protein
MKELVAKAIAEGTAPSHCLLRCRHPGDNEAFQMSATNRVSNTAGDLYRSADIVQGIWCIRGRIRGVETRRSWALVVVIVASALSRLLIWSVTVVESRKHV